MKKLIIAVVFLLLSVTVQAQQMIELNYSNLKTFGVAYTSPWGVGISLNAHYESGVPITHVGAGLHYQRNIYKNIVSIRGGVYTKNPVYTADITTKQWNLGYSVGLVGNIPSTPISVTLGYVSAPVGSYSAPTWNTGSTGGRYSITSELMLGLGFRF